MFKYCIGLSWVQTQESLVIWEAVEQLHDLFAPACVLELEGSRQESAVLSTSGLHTFHFKKVLLVKSGCFGRQSIRTVRLQRSRSAFEWPTPSCKLKQTGHSDELATVIFRLRDRIEWLSMRTRQLINAHINKHSGESQRKGIGQSYSVYSTVQPTFINVRPSGLC